MKNIAIISLGTGGTMGHMTLTTKLSDLLVKHGHKVFLISESNYNPFSNIKNNKILSFKIKKQKHTKTVGGCLNYKYKEKLIELFQLKKIDVLFFSTFYDLEVIKSAKKLGIKSYLISYPLRDSHREAIICRKYNSHFEKVFTLTDVSKVREKYSNEVFVKPFLFKKNKSPTTTKIKKILFTCGGGGRPSSKVFFSLIKKIIKNIRLKYPDIEMILIRGNSSFNLNLKGVKIVDWSNNFIKLLGDVDLVISEAGYYTFLDLLSLNKPAILIPGERRIDNQELRAVEFEKRGLGEFFFPTEDPKLLFDRIRKIIDNPKILEDYKENYKKFKLFGKEVGKTILEELK